VAVFGNRSLSSSGMSDRKQQPLLDMRALPRPCLDASMGHGPLADQQKRIVRNLFGCLFSLYLLTSSGRVRTMDEVLPDLQAESLATNRTTAVPQAVASGIFYGKLDLEGNPQAPYGAGQALATVPWYLLGRILAAVVPGVPPQSRDIASDAMVVASSAAYAALAMIFLYFLLGLVSTNFSAALGATLMVALATPIFAYSSWFFSEPLAAALLLGAALAILPSPPLEAISDARALLAGTLLGMALWVRPTHALAVPVFAIAAALANRGRAARSAALVLLAAAIFGGAYLARNRILFGDFFDFGYPAVAEGGRRLNTFETPLATGLYGLLLSPGKSIFLFAPPLLLAIPGFGPLARRSASLAVLASATPIIYLLFFARYTQWEGGYCFGPRYLVPVIPLLALGLGPLLAKRNRGILRLALLLAVAGFLVQAVGMSTSFLEGQATGAYYDPQWNYRMSYAPLFSQAQLFLRYLTQSGPAPIGRGFDRWFVFLSKAGISPVTVWTVLGLELLAVVFFSWRLYRAATSALSSPFLKEQSADALQLES
jgi:hypothetical protein